MQKNRYFFGFTIFVAVVFQVAAAYFSVQEALTGSIVTAFLYFLFVPALGVVLGFYYSRIRERARRERNE